MGAGSFEVSDPAERGSLYLSYQSEWGPLYVSYQWGWGGGGVTLSQLPVRGGSLEVNYQTEGGHLMSVTHQSGGVGLGGGHLRLGLRTRTARSKESRRG